MIREFKLDFFNISQDAKYLSIWGASKPRTGEDSLLHALNIIEPIKDYIRMILLLGGEIHPSRTMLDNADDVDMGLSAEDWLQSDNFRIFCKFYDINSGYIRKRVFGATMGELKGYHEAFTRLGGIGR